MRKLKASSARTAWLPLSATDLRRAWIDADSKYADSLMHRSKIRWRKTIFAFSQATTSRPLSHRSSSVTHWQTRTSVNEQPSRISIASHLDHDGAPLDSGCVDGQGSKNVQDANTIPTKPKNAGFIPTRSLAVFEDTPPPSTKELAFARNYFHEGSTSLIYSSTKFRTVPSNSIPEV